MKPHVLYHFTCIDSAPSIEREGITRGYVPIFGMDGLELRGGWSWLTDDPDPAGQSWIRRPADGAKCDRSEFRFSVDPSALVKLTRWLDHPLRRQFRSSALADFELYPEVVARWWLAKTPIPRTAIRDLTRFPVLA